MPLTNQALTNAGMPDLTKFGVPSIQQFMPQEKKESLHNDVKMLYRDLVGKGMHPKEAAKQAQAQTGHSVVTGQPIRHAIKQSKKDHHIIGQYGTSSGKASSGRFGQYAMKG